MLTIVIFLQVELISHECYNFLYRGGSGEGCFQCGQTRKLVGGGKIPTGCDIFYPPLINFTVRHWSLPRLYDRQLNEVAGTSEQKQIQSRLLPL